MQISFSPQRQDTGDHLTLSKEGEILTIDGEVFNFTDLPEGATIPAGVVPCKWITGPVERTGGRLCLTLLLPHGPNPPQAVAFPATIIVTEDGPIPVPQEDAV